MAAGFDLYGLALAVAVLALVGWFFWHVGASVLLAGRRVAALLDGSAQRQRAAIEHERIHGPTPLWLKAVRFVLIASLLALLGYRFWIMMAA